MYSLRKFWGKGGLFNAQNAFVTLNPARESGRADDDTSDCLAGEDGVAALPEKLTFAIRLNIGLDCWFSALIRPL